jgi:hypothetical protein
MSEDPVIYQTAAAMAETRTRIRDKAKRFIWVTFRREGIHRFPAAASDSNLADVAFLANEHRHIFHFHVKIEVFHNDRDIEFIQFKRWLESLYQNKLELNFKSCEMISDDLYEVIASRYPGRDIVITVSEDGENGATIRYNTTKPNLNVVI